jgi:hypothetical protein
MYSIKSYMGLELRDFGLRNLQESPFLLAHYAGWLVPYTKGTICWWSGL